MHHYGDPGDQFRPSQSQGKNQREGLAIDNSALLEFKRQLRQRSLHNGNSFILAGDTTGCE